MVDLLDSHNLETETENLDRFYDSVRRRVEGIPKHDAAARQRIIKDLYGHFFAIAFPKVAESLGIVYTPIEVVDFILRATEAALNEHFNGASIADPGVHILDPFTGTGTLITRLLQSGLISSHDLARKYTEEIHANEILLLAYYIAAVKIESTSGAERGVVGGAESQDRSEAADACWWVSTPPMSPPSTPSASNSDWICPCLSRLDRAGLLKSVPPSLHSERCAVGVIGIGDPKGSDR